MQSWKFLIEYLISKYLILYIDSFLDNFYSRNYTFEINYIIYKENYKKSMCYPINSVWNLKIQMLKSKCVIFPVDLIFISDNYSFLWIFRREEGRLVTDV